MKYVAWIVGLLVAGVVVDRVLRTLGEVYESAARAGMGYAPDDVVEALNPPEPTVDMGETPDSFLYPDPTDGLLPDPTDPRVVSITPGDSLLPR